MGTLGDIFEDKAEAEAETGEEFAKRLLEDLQTLNTGIARNIRDRQLEARKKGEESISSPGRLGVRMMEGTGNRTIVVNQYQQKTVNGHYEKISTLNITIPDTLTQDSGIQLTEHGVSKPGCDPADARNEIMTWLMDRSLKKNDYGGPTMATVLTEAATGTPMELPKPAPGQPAKKMPVPAGAM